MTSRLVFSTALTTAVLLFVLKTGQSRAPQQMIPASGQAAASESSPSSPTIWITVQNKNGAPTELSATDLEVKLDGTPTAISNVRRLSPALRYCLLLDTSGSSRDTRKAQHDEAVALLSKIPHAGRDYGLLIDFNDKPWFDAEGTDPQKLIRNIKQDARGSTAMYDAMVACSDRLSKLGSSTGGLETPGIMFLLSDGVDNSSRTNRDGAERALIVERIRVYWIGQEYVGNYLPSEVKKANKSLMQLVESTGGKALLWTKTVTLDQIVQDLSSELTSFYAVTLSAGGTMPRGRLCKLEVRCEKIDCSVTAPREYFVPLH